MPVAMYFVDKAIELSLDLQDVSMDNISELVNKPNPVLNMGKQIAVADQQPDKGKTSKARFVQNQSPPGGRHDNRPYERRAHQGLADIREISSEQPEYLPLHGEEREKSD